MDGFLEVTIPGRVDVLQTIEINENGEVQKETVFDMKMEDYDGTEIVIEKEYILQNQKLIFGKNVL